MAFESFFCSYSVYELVMYVLFDVILDLDMVVGIKGLPPSSLFTPSSFHKA